MSRLFGTDGVRGIANDELTPELAYCIGRAGAAVASGREPACFLVGRDTRASGEMLECAVIAGILSTGCWVRRVGVVTTPALSYLVSKTGCSGGFVVSASHNPFQYNGIKILSPEGCKLPDEMEDKIEAAMMKMRLKDDLPRGTQFAVGRLLEDNQAVRLYVQRVVEVFGEGCLSGLRVVLDCAHGATYQIAPEVFRLLGAEVTVINAQPDGFNINHNCGSTAPKGLSQAVVSTGAQLGIAYDGDGDRAIAVDEQGNIVDGDQIMAIFADYMAHNGSLKGGAVAATVLSNLGLEIMLAQRGIRLVRTPVGDKHVFQRMVDLGLNLGGEQSGHIILRDFATTGDGLITSAYLAWLMKLKGASLSELARIMEKVPQVALNVVLQDHGLRQKVLKHPKLEELKAKAQERLGADGRVVVRGSGTEPVIRVLVECRDGSLAGEVAEELRQGINQLASESLSD
ncbi:MAG: phosphoglucosamine mutase [Bacillota bacterium]